MSKTKKSSKAEKAVNPLEALQAQVTEANDKYLRLYAEFDNFKRRTSKERIELLQTAGKEVIILERNTDFGLETSARNSEVIHAGIYYPEGSLKAKLCVQGRKLLYSYCQERHVPHKQCGKLIVATSASQVAQLASIQAKAMPMACWVPIN